MTTFINIKNGNTVQAEECSLAEYYTNYTGFPVESDESDPVGFLLFNGESYAWMSATFFAANYAIYEEPSIPEDDCDCCENEEWDFDEMSNEDLLDLYTDVRDEVLCRMALGGLDD